MTQQPPRSSTIRSGDDRGLDDEGVRRRLAEFGPNQLAQTDVTSAWTIAWAQFRSPLIAMLLLSCVVSAILGELVDGVAIAVIVVINALVGFVQEHRAATAMHALRAMAAPRARVLRAGHQTIIPATAVVPDDVLLLEAGDVVPADATVVEAHALSANEAALTGESVPADKAVAPVAADAPLAERHDRVFMGTSVATGTGVARVVATGMRTELGKVAHLLETAEESATPLQRRLEQTSRVLLTICLGVVAVTAAIGFLRHRSALEILMSAVSLAVAAVPESLPAVVTIALAVGVRRMAARHVLIRNLAAVETLGSATVVCTDKTGTLTTGVMAVRETWGSDSATVLDAASACCDAERGRNGGQGTGDPTELALLTAAAHHGIERDRIEQQRPRVSVRPFDSDRKRMSIYRADGRNYVKGGVESVVQLCREGRAGAIEANEQMAARGLRVLAIAVGESEEERDLRLVGLVGIADPPRSEAIEAVADARAAGIRTVMITGDHPVTARAIARELGIVREGDNPDDVVHARASPEDKLRIVRSFKSRGEVVAMTGDGVNDAPALREAHIGIAMGRGGTEVSREASDMILTDDNFASIISAVVEGRGVFDNIRKTVVYLLTGNAGELAVMLGAAVLGLPLPLLPLHLLWINLVTDGLPALTLAMDPPQADLLRRPPRAPAEPMLGTRQWCTIVVVGLLEASLTLAVFAWSSADGDVARARDLAFTTLVFCELFRGFSARSATHTFWKVGAFTNLRLVVVVFASIAAQIVIHHLPVAARLFELTALSPWDVVLCVALGLTPVTAIEVSKLIRRALRRRERTPHE